MRACRSEIKAYRRAWQKRVVTSVETHMVQDNDAFEPTGPDFCRNGILSAGRAFFKRRTVPPIWMIMSSTKRFRDFHPIAIVNLLDRERRLLSYASIVESPFRI